MDEVPTDDAALARRIAAAAPGDAAREEAEVCRRYARPIRLYGRRHLRDEQDAADLVQHVLVTVLQSLRAGTVRDPERLGSFVLGTCRLAVRDKRRTEGRRRAILAEFGAELAEAAIEQRPALDHARLEECMAKLAERDRAVLVLSFYAERTPAQIAQELGTSQDGVRVVRHRALTRLAACVRSDETGEES